MRACVRACVHVLEGGRGMFIANWPWMSKGQVIERSEKGLWLTRRRISRTLGSPRSTSSPVLWIVGTGTHRANSPDVVRPLSATGILEIPSAAHELSEQMWSLIPIMSGMAGWPECKRMAECFRLQKPDRSRSLILPSTSIPSKYLQYAKTCFYNLFTRSEVRVTG